MASCAPGHVLEVCSLRAEKIGTMMLANARCLCYLLKWGCGGKGY
jgi:hypothetical protein